MFEIVFYVIFLFGCTESFIFVFGVENGIFIPESHTLRGIQCIFRWYGLFKEKRFQCQQITACNVWFFVILCGQFINVDSVLADSDGFSQIITACIFSVDNEVNREHFWRICQTELCTDIADESVSEHTAVKAVGKQCPVLVFAHAEQTFFLFKFQLVRLFVGKTPCEIASATDKIQRHLFGVCENSVTVITRVAVRDIYSDSACTFDRVVCTVVHFLDGAETFGSFVNVKIYNREIVVCQDIQRLIFRNINGCCRHGCHQQCGGKCECGQNFFAEVKTVVHILPP